MTLAVVHATVVTKLYAKGHRVTVSFKVCATSRRTSASRISGRSRSSSRTEDLGADGSREARQDSGQAAEPTGPNKNAGLEMIGGLTTALSLLFIAASVFGSIWALGAAWTARWFVRQPPASTPTTWPDVSILKPLCGAEAQLSENIETYFHQDYPGKIQFVFGVQDPADRAIPVVKSLIERYPGLDIQLVVNAAAHGANRKVSSST